MKNGAKGQMVITWVTGYAGIWPISCQLINMPNDSATTSALISFYNITVN